MNRTVIALLVWFLPIVLLLLSLVTTIAWPVFLFPLALQIVVSLAAAFIAYLLFTQKPKYYLIWGIVFILFILIFNPIITISAFSGLGIPLALVAACVFFANWWFVFRSGYKIF